MQGVNTIQNQQPNFQGNEVTYKPEYANVNGKMTVRQISMVISPWKGQFERADKLIKQREASLDSIGHSILQMDSSYDNCCKLHNEIHAVVKQCSLETDKLLKQAKSFLKNQEERVKRYNQAKRLVDLIKNENTLDKGTSWLNAVQVPNHLLIQLAKDLLFQIRSYGKQVDDLENNVNALLGANGSNDLSMIESLLDMHHESILAQNTKIASLVARAEHIEGNLGKSIDMEQFMKAFHPVKHEAVSQAPKQEMSDIKAKIENFKRFNKALTGDGNGNKPIHLGNLLSPIMPNNANFMQQQPQQTQQQPQQPGTGLFGQQTTTQQQPGTTGGLFGGTTQQQTTGLFGQPSTTQQQPGTTGLFGQPTTQQQSTGLFGQPSTQTGTTGLFGQPSTTPQTTTSGLFGQPTTTTTTGLFGQPSTTPQTTTSGLFGQPSTTQSTGTGLFGQPTQQQSTGLFGQPSTQPTTTGLFGQPTQQQQQPGGLFGASTQPQQTGGLFGQPTQQQQPGGLFGSNANQMKPQQQGMFGKTVLGSTGTFAVGSSGTAIQLSGQQQGWGQQNTLFGKPQQMGGLLR